MPVFQFFPSKEKGKTIWREPRGKATDPGQRKSKSTNDDGILDVVQPECLIVTPGGRWANAPVSQPRGRRTSRHIPPVLQPRSNHASCLGTHVKGREHSQGGRVLRTIRLKTACAWASSEGGKDQACTIRVIITKRLGTSPVALNDTEARQ